MLTFRPLQIFSILKFVETDCSTPYPQIPHSHGIRHSLVRLGCWHKLPCRLAAILLVRQSESTGVTVRAKQMLIPGRSHLGTRADILVECETFQSSCYDLLSQISLNIFIPGKPPPPLRVQVGRGPSVTPSPGPPDGAGVGDAQTTRFQSYPKMPT